MNTLKHIPAIIILIALLAIAGCGQEEDEMSKLNSSIEELTGGAFEVPLHDDYPLLYAFMRKPPIEVDNGPYFITLQYTFKGGSVGDGYQEDVIGAIEDSQDITILYGPYDGTTSIMIEYSPVFKDAGGSGADETGSWNINGQEVEYSHLDRPGREVLSAYLNLDEAGIYAVYSLSDDFSKEDAKEFTAFLVNELH